MFSVSVFFLQRSKIYVLSCVCLSVFCVCYLRRFVVIFLKYYYFLIEGGTSFIVFLCDFRDFPKIRVLLGCFLCYFVWCFFIFLRFFISCFLAVFWVFFGC